MSETRFAEMNLVVRSCDPARRGDPAYPWSIRLTGPSDFGFLCDQKIKPGTVVKMTLEFE